MVARVVVSKLTHFSMFALKGIEEVVLSPRADGSVSADDKSSCRAMFPGSRLEEKEEACSIT